jgi:hypothetical protein
VFSEAKLNKIGATFKHSPQNPLDILHRSFKLYVLLYFGGKTSASDYKLLMEVPQLCAWEQSIMKTLVILTYLLTELSPSWEAANCAAIQEIPSNFNEPESLSPCSQELSTGLYPEPVRSSPYHPILSL